MITRDKLLDVLEEMERFKEKADKLLLMGDIDNDCRYLPKERGAVRRASMDLTRALAELRK